MKRRPTQKDWLPLSKTEGVASEAPTGEAFRVEWIDFERGIRVGNLEPHERITQILKYGLETRHGTPFVTDRWGRGVYWQWICWLPRANRAAKPVSHDVNFGCAKLYITVDRERAIFQSGLQVEHSRGARKDWDWHRLIRQLEAGTPLDREIQRLVRREGFTARVIGAASATFTAENWQSSSLVRSAAQKAPAGEWKGFQLFYPMSAQEVRACSGHELVQAVLGVFGEVTEAMNECMQVRLTSARPLPPV
jgi:hypothetical protein